MVCYECDIWGLTNGSRVLTKQEVWQQKILPKSIVLSRMSCIQGVIKKFVD